MRAVLVMVLLAIVGTAAIAQPKAPIDRREQVKKKIRAMRAYTLTEELQLDEPTAGKLFPLLARYDDELDKLVAARVDAHKRLVEAASLSDVHAIDHAIDDALANEKGLRSVEDRRVVDFRKILTPQQVARILVVLPAIDRKIQNQLARVIRQQVNGGGGGGGKGGPMDTRTGGGFVDDDDGDDDAPMVHDKEPRMTQPPPRTPQVSAQAVITVTSQPPAHVFLDGVDTGLTSPARITTVAGKHKIMFVVGEDHYTWTIVTVAGQVTAFHKDLR